MTEPDFLSRTRDSYDRFAADYAEWVRPELAAKPLERALLSHFAELVRGTGPVVDIGCGPGRITGHLAGLGLDVSGIDLSGEMVAVARGEHPGLRFERGSMTALDLADGSLGGILAWYSVIHVPDELLPGVFAGFHRVLAPGGHLLLGFQAGSAEDLLHLEQARGHSVSLDFHRRSPQQVSELLAHAGLETRASTLRAPDTEGEFPERTAQAFVLARKPLTRKPLPRP